MLAPKLKEFNALVDLSKPLGHTHYAQIENSPDTSPKRTIDNCKNAIYTVLG